MQPDKPLTDIELAKTVMVGIGVLMLSCSGLWLAAFAFNLIK
jgi:hypothetical protein